MKAAPAVDPGEWSRMTQITVLGAGAWGSVLAELLSAAGHDVTLWGRRAVSLAFSPGVSARSSGVVTPNQPTHMTELAPAVGKARVILVVVPSQAMRDIGSQLAISGVSGVPIISCAKGLELGTCKRMTEVLAECLGPSQPILVLSGPNLAGEIAAGKATAAVLAGKDASMTLALQQALTTPTLRLYGNRDVVGVELAGALKNCIAIAAGIAEGLGMGTNARAALITRGLAEIARLGVAAGADPQTFVGLAGVGDLVATCSSALSRNFQLGLRLAAGERLSDSTRSIGHVVEGVHATSAAVQLATRYGVRMPVAQHLAAVLFEGSSVQEALKALLSTFPGDEFGAVGAPLLP